MNDETFSALGRHAMSRRQLLIAGLGVSVLVVLPGCGDDSTGSAGTGSGDAGGAPRRGGSLRVAAVVPAAFYVGSSYDLGQVSWRQMSWPLFLPTAEGFGVENGLADGYEMADGGRLHTVTLREGLTFQDGSPLDARAVVDNLQAMIDPRDPLRDREGAYGQVPVVFGDVRQLAGIRAVDERTVTIAYRAPRGDMRLSLVLAPIVNPTVLARAGYGTDRAALAALGSGPFQITDFSPGQFVEFRRYEDFFEPAYLDRMRFENFEDNAAKGLALRSGQLDVGTNLGSADLEAFATDPAYEMIVAEPPSNVHQMFMFAPVRPELQDARVREAIILATNRQAYVDAFFPDGTAKLATQPILAAEGVQGYNPTLRARPYDPERARALLDEAGVSGLELRIIGWPAGMTPMDEAIVDDLARVGIRAKVTKTDQATFLAEMYRGYDYGITDLPNAGDMFDALQIFFWPGSERIPGDPRSTPAARRALAAVNGATGEQERDRAIQALMQLEHDELMLGVPISVAAVVAVARTAANVRDFRVSPGQVDSQNTAWIAS